METTVITSTDENGEVLVEGLPVGNFLTFFTTCIGNFRSELNYIVPHILLVSMTFQLVGFFLTFFLSTTHAGKVSTSL
jgi:hypothetical protein